MRVGGPARQILRAETQQQLENYAKQLAANGEPWLLLGDGSNTIFCDEGFPGTILLTRNTGIEVISKTPALPASQHEHPHETGARQTQRVRLRVQAGHVWDELVELTLQNGLQGLEALSGIPGRAGSAPVQNIGAYGVELSHTLHSVFVLDLDTGECKTLSAAQLQLGYRQSTLKTRFWAVVLSIDIVLNAYADVAAKLQPQQQLDGATSAGGSDTNTTSTRVSRANIETSNPPDIPDTPAAPVLYAGLAAELGINPGENAPAQKIRETVLRLRHSKGMTLNPADHDTWSAGSFFTNPIVTQDFARDIPPDCPRYPATVNPPTPTSNRPAGGEAKPEEIQRDRAATAGFAVTALSEIAAGVQLRVPEPPAQQNVKLSAAWLIENAGLPAGFRLPGSCAALSSKHTLAITNRGGATAEEIAQLARFIVQRVQQEFGVLLAPEPRIYGLEL